LGKLPHLFWQAKRYGDLLSTRQEAIPRNWSPVTAHRHRGRQRSHRSILKELDRALSDHELIKIKIVGDRAERSEMIASILEITAATCIQSVGGMFLILRSAATPKPHLSNLIRHG